MHFDHLGNVARHLDKTVFLSRRCAQSDERRHRKAQFRVVHTQHRAAQYSAGLQATDPIRDRGLRDIQLASQVREGAACIAIQACKDLQVQGVHG